MCNMPNMPKKNAMLTESEQRELRCITGNMKCADCCETAPTWADVSHGVLICLKCAGKHRALGVNVSRVKSIEMDDWSDIELRRMRVGGNDKMDRFFKASFVKRNLRLSLSDSYGSWSCDLKYDSNTAEQYREKIKLVAKYPASSVQEPVGEKDASARLLRQLSLPPEYIAPVAQSAPIRRSASEGSHPERAVKRSTYELLYWQVACRKGLAGGLFDMQRRSSKKTDITSSNSSLSTRKRGCVDYLQEYVCSMVLAH